MLVAAVAVGCAQIPVLKNLGDALSGNESSPTSGAIQHGLSADGAGTSLSGFLASARAGDSITMAHPETGARIRVVAERMYYAASGRYCRRYEFAPVDGGKTLSTGLACKNGDGHWTTEKSILNPSDVNAPQRSVVPSGS